MPARTCSRAESRRKVMPFSRALLRISEPGRFVENHLADLVVELEQFVDGGAAAVAGAAALDAAGALAGSGSRAIRRGRGR